MITLPAIGRVPAVYTTAGQHAVAARCTLLLAPPGPIPAVKRGREPVELAQLRATLSTWMEKATAGLKVFKPRLTLSLDDAPACDCLTKSASPMAIWLADADGNTWGTRWRLDRRWKELQRQAPGMAAAALAAIDEAGSAGIPIYHPLGAEWHCQWIHWHGEEDESMVLEMDGMNEEEAINDGFPTRGWLETKIPPIAKANRRGIGRARLAREWGPRRDVARAILEVYAAIKANRPRLRTPGFHREDADHCCVGYGTVLRWNEDDPMGQLYDDYANSMFEAYAVEECWGWYPIAKPAKDLQPTLAAIEARFNVARAVEKLLPLVAEEVR